jgi:hypothetical protein
MPSACGSTLGCRNLTTAPRVPPEKPPPAPPLLPLPPPPPSPPRRPARSGACSTPSTSPPPQSSCHGSGAAAACHCCCCCEGAAARVGEAWPLGAPLPRVWMPWPALSAHRRAVGGEAASKKAFARLCLSSFCHCAAVMISATKRRCLSIMPPPLTVPAVVTAASLPALLLVSARREAGAASTLQPLSNCARIPSCTRTARERQEASLRATRPSNITAPASPTNPVQANA